MMDHTIRSALPYLDQAPQRFWQELDDLSIVKQYLNFQYLLLEGDEVGYFPIVISGCLRVYRSDPSGREITLYRLTRGEGCVLSAFAILSQSKFTATAEVEKNSTVLLIPGPVFRDWINRFEVWRNFVFQLLFNQLNAVISKVQSLAFDRVDERLADYLVQNVKQQNVTVLRLTHQQIARDLGTAREVVSRILKEFERANMVRLERGRVFILNLNTLQRYSHRELSVAV